MCPVVDEDTKKFFKLKKGQTDSTFKIVFHKDGLVKQSKPAARNDASTESEEGADEFEVDPKKTSFVTWFFRAEGEDSRNTLLSQVYINCLNRWERYGWTNPSMTSIPPKGVLEDSVSKNLMNEYIN